MNRLTKDLNTPHDDTTYSDVVRDCCDRENIVLTKLKHYEDIEEELGISILDFFRALKGPIFVIDDDGNIVDDEIERVYFNDGCFTTHSEYLELEFSDLGNTWAFTREKLKK